jgi:hypothetical protein
MPTSVLKNVRGRATRIGWDCEMTLEDLAQEIKYLASRYRNPIVVAVGNHGSKDQGRVYRKYGQSYAPNPRYEIPNDTAGLRRVCRDLGCSDALDRCIILNMNDDYDHSRFRDTELNQRGVIAIFGWCYSIDNKHFDGTFGFRDDGHRDGRCIQNRKFTPGASVEYNSSTYGKWISATVERVHSDGTISLDVRARADPSLVRAC